jgi:hypothetical protein
VWSRDYFLKGKGAKVKKVLSIVKSELYHVLNGVKISGVHKNIRGDISGSLYGDISGISGDISGISGDISRISGDISGISGDISGISGDISGISGDISGISGDISGISGVISGISGDIDKAEITEEERDKGVNILDLIK